MPFEVSGAPRMSAPPMMCAYVIEIREDVLHEVDGPMLIHGLQGWNGKVLRVPSQPSLRPDPTRLKERYDRFRAATESAIR